jgi:hypothetical protein
MMFIFTPRPASLTFADVAVNVVSAPALCVCPAEAACAAKNTIISKLEVIDPPDFAFYPLPEGEVNSASHFRGFEISSAACCDN